MGSDCDLNKKNTEKTREHMWIFYECFNIKWQNIYLSGACIQFVPLWKKV